MYYVEITNHIELIKYLIIHTQQAYIFLLSVYNSLLRRYSTDYIKSFQLSMNYFFDYQKLDFFLFYKFAILKSKFQYKYELNI